MQTKKHKIKKIVNEFTSQTIGTKNPEGMCFLTCFPISILLDIEQVGNTISCGYAYRNNSFVNHCWITLNNEGIIVDPTIRQFDSNIKSIYIGKINDNEFTKKYVPFNVTYKEWFVNTHKIWAEPLINKQPRTFVREPEFENKMILSNIKTATILYSCILKMKSSAQIMSSFKCDLYYSPIFKFLKDKSESDNNFIFNMKNEMPQAFNLLLSKALSESE